MQHQQLLDEAIHLADSQNDKVVASVLDKLRDTHVVEAQYVIGKTCGLKHNCTCSFCESLRKYTIAKMGLHYTHRSYDNVCNNDWSVEQQFNKTILDEMEEEVQRLRNAKEAEKDAIV